MNTHVTNFRISAIKTAVDVTYLPDVPLSILEYLIIKTKAVVWTISNTKLTYFRFIFTNGIDLNKYDVSVCKI